MTVAKRATMTLYSGTMDILSHRVRIVLAEKDVLVDVRTNEESRLPPELLAFNPNNILPTLVDRDLVLYESRIIIEYLDERFPHPPLLPVYPIARAKSRLTIFRIEQDWYTLVDRIENGSKKISDAARKELTESLVALAPVFADTAYFLSTEFTLLDCCIAPLLWRLPQLNIHLTSSETAPILEYAKKVFGRIAFQNSLTEYEREFPKYDF